MIGRIAKAAPILSIAVCAAASPSSADVKAGMDAWSHGDYAVAVREWQDPAARGDADALFNLAQAYKFGKGVPQDMAKAEELFGKAAAQGNVEAADNYGLLRYQRGDRAGALPYIQTAAERGDARAQYLLGISSFNGDIVAKDWVRAYALLLLAQQAGLPQAASALAEMDTHIPPAQRQQAAALAPTIAARADSNRAQQPTAANLSAGAPAALPQQSTVIAPAPAAPRPLAPVNRIAQPTRVAASSAPAHVASGPWRVQLGAFSIGANADAMWNRVKGRPELSGHPRINAGSGKVTRLLAGGFATEAAAKAACSKLSAAGISCLVTRN
jgi:cell division septation protein DedD